jgi:hypothetical protein
MVAYCVLERSNITLINTCMIGAGSVRPFCATGETCSAAPEPSSIRPAPWTGELLPESSPEYRRFFEMQENLSVTAQVTKQQM